MTPPVDRMAAIIDEHRPEYGGGARFELFCSARGCEWTTGEEVEDQDAAHALHVAEVIASDDDISVIELPAPSERSESSVTYGNIHRVGTWPATADLRTRYVYFDEVESGDSRSLRAESAAEYATNILAAARAVEAVSER